MTEFARTGPDWCDYRRCGGKGLREVSERAVRRSRIFLTIGRDSWRVCESCADLLERERRNWSRETEKVRRVRLSTPAPKKAPKPEPSPPAEAPPKSKPGSRKARPLVRTAGALAREERREAKRSSARTRKLKRAGKKPAKATFGTAGTKSAKEAERKKRRKAWLAAAPDAKENTSA